MAMNYEKELQKYLTIVTHEGASDLHMSADSRPTLRVDGSLVPMMNEPVLTGDDVMGFVTALVSPIQKEKYLADQEIDFSFQVPGSERFRGNAFFQRNRASAYSEGDSFT
jgi:twitching motility protein PilT